RRVRLRSAGPRVRRARARTGSNTPHRGDACLAGRDRNGSSLRSSDRPLHRRVLLLRPGLFGTPFCPPRLAPYHNTGNPVKIPSTRALWPRPVGEFDKRGTRRLGGEHRGGEVEPGGLAVAPQIGAIRVNAG